VSALCTVNEQLDALGICLQLERDATGSTSSPVEPFHGILQHVGCSCFAAPGFTCAALLQPPVRASTIAPSVEVAIPFCTDHRRQGNFWNMQMQNATVFDAVMLGCAGQHDALAASLECSLHPAALVISELRPVQIGRLFEA
jgi:hypothetical protein